MGLRFGNLEGGAGEGSQGGDERFEEMNDGLNHAIISHEGDDFAKI